MRGVGFTEPLSPAVRLDRFQQAQYYVRRWRRASVAGGALTRAGERAMKVAEVVQHMTKAYLHRIIDSFTKDLAPRASLETLGTDELYFQYPTTRARRP